MNTPTRDIRNYVSMSDTVLGKRVDLLNMELGFLYYEIENGWERESRPRYNNRKVWVRTSKVRWFYLYAGDNGDNAIEQFRTWELESLPRNLWLLKAGEGASINVTFCNPT